MGEVILNDHCPIESPLIACKLDTLYYIKDRLFSQIENAILYDGLKADMF